MKPEITDFPISAVLDGIAASYAPIAEAKGLGWRIEPCTEWVHSDVTLLGRVLRNLVENAVRYTGRGHFQIVCCRVEGRLRIEVEDTGIGIPPEQLDRIYHEFHQVGNQARDRRQGLGLGLAIVRRIADLLGHRIETRSRPGEGSVFSIELPLAMTEAARLPISGDAGSDQNGQGRLVVVIDDDALVLESLEAILTEWGYQAVAAVSAEAAIAELRESGRRPDIVIADYRLQDGRTGTEAILAIRALFDHPIPGLILTGETDEVPGRVHRARRRHRAQAGDAVATRSRARPTTKCRRLRVRSTRRHMTKERIDLLGYLATSLRRKTFR